MMGWINLLPIFIITCMVSYFLLVLSESTLLLVWDISCSWGPVLELSFQVDWVSLSYFCVVMYVSTTVFVYSSSYMKFDPMKASFIIILASFSVSMVVLSFSANLFTSLIGWDGLGVTSFLLILHFQSWNSLTSGLITFITNRLGDSLLVAGLLISLLDLDLSLMLGPSLLLGAFTKSGQLPFSTWLPLAMAAPTPVSSLVHSSTLVTAGVYMLIRFKEIIPDWTCSMGLLLSSLTSALASISALFEWDLKKVIALSTLSHVGLILVFVFLNELSSAMLHFSMHALFKSALFMFVGEIIHESKGSQDMRNMSFGMQPGVVKVGTVVCLASMAGLPYLAGFYSKEMMLGMATGYSGFNLLIFYILAGMTLAYSTRLVLVLFQLPKSVGSLMSPSISLSSFLCLLILSSSVVGSIITEHILSSFYLEASTWSSSSSKASLWGFMSLGLLVGAVISRMEFSYSSKVKLVAQALWFLPSLSSSSTYLVRFSSFFSHYFLDQKGQLDKVWSYLAFSSKNTLFNPGWVVYEAWITTCLLLSIYVLWYSSWYSS